MNENFSPKISVIIPMYNAEKYLSVCLESVLIQTFTDYEVIVVDDCSTDKSCAIAESFLEKFDGRLKIITLPENTGTPGLPRNIGLEFASGKYVFFMDNDDFLIDDALETLYNFAEEYQAEVVYMDCGFISGAEPVPKNIEAAAWDPNDIVEEPTLETENIAVRVEKFLNLRYRWPPWGKLLRRDFLIENDIIFPPVKTSEDISWLFKVICLVKRFLRIPTPLYVNRSNEKSITRLKRTPEQMLSFWINPLLNGLEMLSDFMQGLKFFKENPAVRLQVLNLFANIHLQHMTKPIQTLEPQEVYEIFQREFSKAGSTQPALIAYLLVMNNLYRNELLNR